MRFEKNQKTASIITGQHFGEEDPGVVDAGSVPLRRVFEKTIRKR